MQEPGWAGGLRPSWVPGEPGQSLALTPASHPGHWQERCYFAIFLYLFLFLRVSHQPWGLSRAGLPRFHLSPMEQLQGAERTPPSPRGVPLQRHVPCNAITLQTCPRAADSPTPAAVSPRSNARKQNVPPHPLPFTPAPARPPACGKATLRRPWDGAVASKVGGTKGAGSCGSDWHRGPASSSLK